MLLIPDIDYQKVLLRLITAPPEDVVKCQDEFDKFVIENPQYKIPEGLLKLFQKSQ